MNLCAATILLAPIGNRFWGYNPAVMQESSANPADIRITRFSFLRAVFWRSGVAMVSAGWAILGVLDFVNSKIVPELPDAFKRVWNALYVLPPLSLRTWIIGLLVLMVVMLFEGAYRFVLKQETIFTSKISDLQTDVADLKEELEPKLAIVFESEYPYLYDDSAFAAYEMRIGVKNVSGKELSRVKVQLDDVSHGTSIYNSLPLHVTRTKRLYEYPYQQEFFLNPGETEYVDLCRRLKDRSWGSFSYSGGAPGQIIEDETYEFTITAMASEGKPFHRRAALSIDPEPPGFKFELIEISPQSQT